VSDEGSPGDGSIEPGAEPPDDNFDAAPPPPPAGFSAPPPPMPLPPPPTPAAPPPPGPYFAAPESSAGAGYATPPPATVVPALRWRSLKGLTTALTVFLWLVVAGAVFGAIAYVARISALSDIINNELTFDRAQSAHDADDLVQAASGILAFLGFVIYVLIIIWTYRAAKNNEALGRPYPRLKPGWAIAGWLIPLANLVIPVLILQDLWRGSDVTTRRGDPNWRANHGSPLIGWYWGVFLVSIFTRSGLGRTSAHLLDNDELRELRNHDTVAVVGMAFTIVAAILAIQVVRRIAARQENCLRAHQEAWRAQS
jgi:hypothetical protein